MSQDERLPEELTDTERALLSLAPRGSRIDRDRLMIALGEQSAARGLNPWKWATATATATAASLLITLVLGVRPALETQTVGPQQIAEQEDGSNAVEAISAAALDSKDEISTKRDDGEDFDWLRALASGRFDSSRPLTVRPAWTSGDVALRNAEVRDETENTRPVAREPMLRWGDERLRRGSL